MHSFAVCFVLECRNLKCSTMTGLVRLTLPVTTIIERVSDSAPPSPWNLSAYCPWVAAMPSKPVRKSTCQKARRNSPSVMPCSPAASCIATARRISRSSTAFRFCAVILLFLKSCRAFFSSVGRSRLPTWSARKGGRMRRQRTVGTPPRLGSQAAVARAVTALANDRFSGPATVGRAVPALAVAEQQEAETGAEPPGGVDDRADEHRGRHEAGRDRLTLERRDDEPCHQGRQDRAEDERRADQRGAAESVHRGGEHHAPDAAPEGERPDERHAPGLGRGEGVRRARCEARGVQQGGGALVKDENGGRTGEEADDQPALHTPAIMRSWARRRSGNPERRSRITGAMPWRRSLRTPPRSSCTTSLRQPKYAARGA